MRSFKARQTDAGKRADVFVASKFSRLSRSSLERLFDKKLVRLAGKTLKPSYRIKSDDKLEVDSSQLRSRLPKIALPTIYEDEDVLVLDKPEGVLTHAKGALNEEATVASFIRPGLSDFAGTNRDGIVHRLDRATSGVIITAKNHAAQSQLQKQFSLRKVKKNYLAIVEGMPEMPEAIIDVPLERNPKKPQTFKVGAKGKPAITRYKVLKCFVRDGKDYSLVELSPQTGRTHQIRVHMKYIGTPVLGDALYGTTQQKHLYLHSAVLEITVPGSARKVFEAEVPDYFKEFMDEATAA